MLTSTYIHKNTISEYMCIYIQYIISYEYIYIYRKCRGSTCSSLKSLIMAQRELPRHKVAKSEAARAAVSELAMEAVIGLLGMLVRIAPF